MYSSRNPDWESGGGNPFLLRRGTETVEVWILGDWAHTALAGPLFIPLIPIPTRGNVRIQIAGLSPRVGAIRNLAVVADGKALDVTGCSGGSGQFSCVVQPPGNHPSELAVWIDDLPALTLSVDAERCYWLGDTFAHYVGCSDAARSTTVRLRPR